MDLLFKTYNIVIDIKVVDGLHPHEHEEVVRLVGLKASELIGEAEEMPLLMKL